MTLVDNNSFDPSRSNIILIDPQRYLPGTHNDLIAALEEQHGVRGATIIHTSDPDAQWLETNHLGALSNEQRALFETDRVVMLLQHPINPDLTITIRSIAQTAVSFGCEKLASDRRVSIPISDLAKPDAWQKSHDAGQAAWGPYVVERSAEFSEAELWTFFRQAYRELASPTAKALIDRYNVTALNEALQEAWSERRDRIQQGRFVELRQAE